MEISKIQIEVNGISYKFSVGDGFGQIPSNETLSQTLRNRLALTGTKESCEEGACGCCTVIKDGKAVNSCMLLTVACDGSEIVTIEGLQDPETGELDEVQQAFIDKYAFQCGFCTPGIIMTTKALLMSNPNPSKEEVEDALSGNYCRCISQYHVFDAIESIVNKEA